MSEHVHTTLRTPQKQKLKEVAKCLEDKYGRTRLEKIKELILDSMGLKGDDYEGKEIFFM